MQPSGCGQPVTAIRALLRFLVTQGVVAQGLEGAVPPVLTWQHASLPRHISPVEVKQVIAACDPETDIGRRENAVILLLAQLGLRAHEIIRLKLEDIDWVEGHVLVRAGKCRRERRLPLSQEVGNALVAYLRKARPATPYREGFLRWRPPIQPLKSSVTISALVSRVLNRAGVRVHRPGAHIFRHSLATRMICQGATFKQVADILGHQSLATTGIYAKLDLPSLSQVALPWPRRNPMNPDLWTQVELYVGLRIALGYSVRSEEKLLKDFVRFLNRQSGNETIRAQMALEWACSPSPKRGPAGQSSRLKVVRRFLSYLQAVNTGNRGA